MFRSVIENSNIASRIAERYAMTLPAICRKLTEVSTPGEAKHATRKLVYTTVDPWTVCCRPKQSQARLGWTESLDWDAKQQSKLIKKWEASQKLNALDRGIKRVFRNNTRKLRNRLGDEMRNGDLPSHVKTMKTALSLSNDTKPVLCQTVNPENFT